MIRLKNLGILKVFKKSMKFFEADPLILVFY